MEEFQLEFQWQAFLKRVSLKEEDMPKGQISMMKQAFMGAIGQVLVLLRESMPDDEEEGVKILKDMWQQCVDYWSNLVNNQN